MKRVYLGIFLTSTAVLLLEISLTRIFSYMEEFRMQAKMGERVLVEGNLEKVVNGTKTFHQITLSYGPRYYEQTLKVIKE